MRVSKEKYQDVIKGQANLHLAIECVERARLQTIGGQVDSVALDNAHELLCKALTSVCDTVDNLEVK